ncbi:MAG: hypothetical protein JWM58_265, partial [Rhizobium sp.]|nr:hypothetical protein [Rhizobium sp.]
MKLQYAHIRSAAPQADIGMGRRTICPATCRILEIIPNLNDDDLLRGTGNDRPGRSTPESVTLVTVEDCDASGGRIPAHPKGRALL